MEEPDVGGGATARTRTDLNGDTIPNREPPAVENMSKIECLAEIKTHGAKY